MNQMAAEPTGLENYRNFMTESHRRFHDRIVADLNGILPICNQGKCTAADISTNVTEQQQITDLMQKVEQLCVELSESVTDLFAQYYRERGKFCGAAYCTTALIKVNLVDRSLQDRFTDVRWWAKAPSLVSSVVELEKTGRQLDKEFVDLAAYMEASIATFRIPTLATNWTSVDLSQAVQNVQEFFPRKRELMFNAAVREQFQRSVNSLAEFLKKGEGQEGTTGCINKVIKRLVACEDHVKKCCEHLQMIAQTYPTLEDLLVTDHEGFVIANARSDRRQQVLGTNVYRTAWYAKATGSTSGQANPAQDGRTSEDLRKLVFAAPIRNPEAQSGATLGVLGVYCDLQAEFQPLLEDYMPRQADGRLNEGWYSFFTDETGVVICSSDPTVVVPGTKCDLPRSHCKLDAGTSYWSHAVFKGKECLAFSARSDDNQGLFHTGWISHVLAPATEILQAEKKDSRLQISQRQVMRSKLVPEINKTAYLSLQDERQAIKLISLNGILFASQLGKRGASLAPVFDKITATGDSATSRMESMLHEMASSEIELNLHSLETLSKQAVDLLTQKIQDRGHALRLWTQSTQLRTSLLEPTPENVESCGRMLKTINDDYPMYQNVILLNACGDVVACSRPTRMQDAAYRGFADSNWFRNAIHGNDRDAVQVQESAQSEYGQNRQSSIIFARAVYDQSSADRPIGILACVFGWQVESSMILQTCLPQSATGRPIANSVAFLTNAEGTVVESTQPGILPLGQTFPMPEEHSMLPAGKTIASIFEHQKVSYILASSKMGARAGLGRIRWSAHVMRPLT